MQATSIVCLKCLFSSPEKLKVVRKSDVGTRWLPAYAAHGVRLDRAGVPRDRVGQWADACVPARKRRMVVRWFRSSSSGDVFGALRTRGSSCRPSDVVAAACLPHLAKPPCVIGRPGPCCDPLVLPRRRTVVASVARRLPRTAADLVAASWSASAPRSGAS